VFRSNVPADHPLGGFYVWYVGSLFTPGMHEVNG
jgi:hypothetical protein